jgi:hypothetical protein
MNNLLDSNFWFNVSPGAFAGLTLKIILGVVLLLIVAAVALRIYKAKRRGIYGSLLARLSTFFSVFAIFILIFLFFNYEIIPILSSRFWYPLIVVIMGVWLVFILRSLKDIKLKKEETEKQKEIKKYLP